MSGAPRPYTLVAELTYACPLHCVYCSNPMDLARHRTALDTAAWVRVLREAEALGVMQVNFTGGEPLLRDDLEEIVAEASRLDLYTNLITSGMPLERDRLARLRDVGLSNVQVSIQDSRAEKSDRIAGVEAFHRKLAVMRWVKELGFPLTVNTVLQRENIDHVGEVIALAEELRADRLELANAQYLGWALANRTALLPAREQIETARAVAAAARVRLEGRMEVLFVVPDYYTEYPPSCMEGWGQKFMVISPDGLLLPCLLAHTLPGLSFGNVQNAPLAELWADSPGMNAFRGEEWMPALCRTCDKRAVDFGGCRCQAFHLTGKAAATDPACTLSPDHGLVEHARDEAKAGDSRLVTFRYRWPRA
ncbi:MAG: pyrroloquinoline quinone biosynthesis protein PqqE [Myxococcales bacterium]